MSGRIISKGVSISSVYDGIDGTSPWVADLDNEMDSVSCDDTGKPVSQQTVTTKLSLYHGATAKSFKITGITRNNSSSMGTGVTVSPTASSTTRNTPTTFSVTYATTAKITGKDDFAITIEAVEDNTVTKTLHFTVNGVVGDVFNLMPSVNEVVFAVDSSTNQFTPSSVNLTCGYKKNDKGTITEYPGTNYSNTATSANNGHPTAAEVSPGHANAVYNAPYNIFYRTYTGNSASGWNWLRNAHVTVGNVTTWAVISIPSSTDYTAVEFILSDSASIGNIGSSNIIDRETVPIVKSGKKGDKGDKGEGYDIIATPSELIFNPNTGTFVGGATIVFQAMKNGAQYTQSNCLRVIGIDSSGSETGTATFGNSSVTISPANSNYSAYKAQIIGGSVLACTYVPIVRYGSNGSQGNPGKTGRWYYYAGEYSNTATYKMDTTQAPYVKLGEYDNGKPKFWMFDNKGVEPSGGTRSISGISPTGSGQNAWTQMAAEQEYYIAKAFFGDYAQFGSFIINGDWMISSKGNLSLGARAVSISSYTTVISKFKAKSTGRHDLSFNVSITGSGNVWVALKANSSGGSQIREGNYSTSQSASLTELSLTAGTTYYLVAAITSGSPSANVNMPTLSCTGAYMFFDPQWPAEKEYIVKVTQPVINTSSGAKTDWFELKEGITYMITFTITGLTSGTVDFSVANTSGTFIETYTVGRSGTFRMVVLPTADGNHRCFASRTSSTGTVSVTSVSLTAMYFPKYAVDGLNGTTLQNNGLFKGDIEASKFTMGGSDFITEMLPGIIRFTSVRNPLSCLTIGDDGSGMSIKLTDSTGKLIWDISKLGSGKNASKARTWETIKLKSISYPPASAYVLDTLNFECTDYYLCHGGFDANGNWTDGDGDHDGKVYTNTTSFTTIGTGWYTGYNHPMFEYASTHGGQYGVLMYYYVDGKVETTDTMLFNT